MRGSQLGRELILLDIQTIKVYEKFHEWPGKYENMSKAVHNLTPTFARQKT